MELLERERSLEALTSVLNDVASTCGRAVLISGDAGIGKDSYREHFVRLNQHWARVLWGGCEALFTPRPLGPLYDIAHQTDSDLLKSLETRTPRPSIFAAFLDDLRASGRPSIVVFECRGSPSIQRIWYGRPGVRLLSSVRIRFGTINRDFEKMKGALSVAMNQ